MTAKPAALQASKVSSIPRPTNKVPLEDEGLIIDLINGQQMKASSSSRRYEDCERKEADCPSRGKTAIEQTEISGSVLSGKIVEVSGVTSHTTPGNTKFPLFRPCRKRWKSYTFNSVTKWMMSPSRRNDRYQRSRRYRTRKSIP